MTTIAQIDPASGPQATHPDMATWEADLDATHHKAIVWETGDVGGLTLNDTDPLSTLIVGRRQHDGQADSAGFARASSAWGLGISNVTARGMHITGNLTLGASGQNRSAILVEDLNITGIFQPAAVSTSAATLTTECAIRNCVAYGTGGVGPLAIATADGAAAIIDFDVEHCTFGGNLSSVLRTNHVNAVATMIGNWRNNFCATVSQVNQAEVGTNNHDVTYSYNASEDGTADDFGGSGHLVNQAAADWFVDPEEDLRLKAGSPGLKAAVDIADLDYDFRGRWRPPGRRDIGFHQRSRGSYVTDPVDDLFRDGGDLLEGS